MHTLCILPAGTKIYSATGRERSGQILATTCHGWHFQLIRTITFPNHTLRQSISTLQILVYVQRYTRGISTELWKFPALKYTGEHVEPWISGRETSSQQVAVAHQLIKIIHALQVTAVESSNSRIASAPHWPKSPFCLGLEPFCMFL